MTESAIHAASWLVNPDAPPISGGALYLRNGTVAAVGTLSELRRACPAPVFEYPDCILIPGFINAHTHLELTHFPSWRLRTHIDYNPRRFTDWIIQLIKISRGLSPSDYPPSLLEGMRMCLESGTTAVGDIVTRPVLSEQYSRVDLTGRLYFEVLGQDPAQIRDKLDLSLKAAGSLAGREIAVGFSPHSPFTVGVEHLATLRNSTAANQWPLAIHVSESAAESEFISDSRGPLAEDLYPFVGWETYLGAPKKCSSTELLDRHGLLGPTTLAVHCVHVTMGDVRILKERGASIVLCPRSNRMLDVGRAPVSLFKKFGIPLALGTDSLASNDSLSLWDEMRFALEAFTRELTPADLFRMVTIGGASALGISSSCGSIEVGKRADFQVVGNCCGGEQGMLERVIGSGAVQEVFVSGNRFTGNLRQDNASRELS